MSSDRHNQTLADYVALAISPALIMGLIASLVFFLINVLYVGDYVERMRWILFFFVFGAVLIARMTMLDDTSSRAALYGVPLGFLTWLSMQMFVEYPDDSGIRELSFLLNAGLIGLVWWCAHRLTWDCTNIDEETDVNAEGLLQAAGLLGRMKEEGGRMNQDNSSSSFILHPSSFRERWRRYREEREKKRSLGVWVVYFSLGALPLFGLGQALLAADDVERRRTSFWLMFVYVGCGLGLLLTTCFLSLRRYLRQRRLQMPAAMTGVWLTAGVLLIAALLVIGAVLPRPDAEYSLFSFSPAKSPQRGASKYALKDGRSGDGGGRPGGNDPKDKKDDADSGGDKGQQKGERGAATSKGEKGSGGKDGKSSGNNDNEGKNKGQGENQNKGDPGSGRDRAAKKDNSQQAQADDNNRRSSEEGERLANGRRQPAGEPANQPADAGRSPAAALRDFIGRIAPIVKWIVFAIIALAVLFFVLRSGLQFLANFSDWARRLLDSLRNFWANLFGSRRQTVEEEQASEQDEERLRERPFASFRNPFAGERIRMSTPELIRYTFAAVQAWARERDLGRQLGETPMEFAARVGAEVPALEHDLEHLAVLFGRAVYARSGLPADSVDMLRQLWQRLEAIAKQPLSA